MDDRLSLLVQLTTMVSSLATVVSVWIAFTIYRRQMNAQVFITYTQRYESIMSGFPENAFSSRYAADVGLPPESDELTLAVLRYLNLCSEEYYLCKTKHLDRSLWEIWETELKRMVRSPLLRREWRKLHQEFVSYPEFLHFVEQIQRTDPAMRLAPSVHA